MPRRTKPYIPQFFDRDKKAMTLLSKAGHANESHLKSCGLVQARIKNYVKDKLVESITSKDGTAYKLTDKGKEVAEKNWGIRDHYHAQSPNHDLVIADKYMSLSPEIRESWVSETEARQVFRDELQQLRDQGQEALANRYEEMYSAKSISMPDAIYVNAEGNSVCFEVVTNNYGPAEIQAKIACAGVLQASYESTRV